MENDQEPQLDLSKRLALPVYSRDGERVGLAEEVNNEAVKVSATPKHDGFWLRREAIARTTPGGVIFLAVPLRELDRWRWESSD